MPSKEDVLRDFLSDCDKTISVSEVNKKTGLSYRTIEKYIDGLGYRIDRRPNKILKPILMIIKKR